MPWRCTRCTGRCFVGQAALRLLENLTPWILKNTFLRLTVSKAKRGFARVCFLEVFQVNDA